LKVSVPYAYSVALSNTGFASKVEARCGGSAVRCAEALRASVGATEYSGYARKVGPARNLQTHLSEGQRPSAHQAAEPLLANDF
jgi:hypothetical protein